MCIIWKKHYTSNHRSLWLLQWQTAHKLKKDNKYIDKRSKLWGKTNKTQISHIILLTTKWWKTFYQSANKGMIKYKGGKRIKNAKI